ncbi:hypothetical protein [Peribacillus sp. FSL E2-0218]
MKRALIRHTLKGMGLKELRVWEKLWYHQVMRLVWHRNMIRLANQL